MFGDCFEPDPGRRSVKVDLSARLQEDSLINLHSGGPFVDKETGPEEVAEVICRYSILLISSSDLHSSNSSVVY
jgi:hypothetical protein